MKYALIIGNNKYDDRKLAQLKTPAADSQALAKVLDDKTIGSFDEVTPVINQTETMVRRIISAFLTDKKPDDLILLYFSGHGVLDDRGRLYLALRDTQLNLLKATSIPSSFIADEMDSCRSKRQILVLDCCHSGAFARGTKGEQKAITETTFEGSGFGRVVLTASDSTQYALEGDQVIKQTELSLFTHFLLEGLRTGDADVNNDGNISLDEWYDYTYAKVISETPRQVPHKWSYNQQGDLIIARNPFVKKKVVELPYELVQALESSFVGIRESGVTELGKYLHSPDPEMVELAIASLQKMKQDDSRRISSLSERLLSEIEQARTPSGSVRVTPSKIAVPQTEPEIRDVIRDSRAPAPQMAVETVDVTSNREMSSSQKMTETELPAVTSGPVVKKENVQMGTSLLPRRTNFDLLPWFKWAAIAVLGFTILNPLQIYLSDYKIVKSVPVLFALSIGLVAVVQWLVFRNQLPSWWIAASMAGGILLGGITNFLYTIQQWWAKDVLFSVLLIFNFVLGIMLIRRAQEKPRDVSPVPSAPSITEFIEVDARRNIFVMLLSIFLVLYAFVAFASALSDSGSLNPFSWLGNTPWILYGITSILAGVSFFLIKETPRTFGFVMLAFFLLLNGLIVELFTFAPDSSPYLFNLSGTMSLLASVYFVSHRETWKHTRYIMLSCYLVFVSLVYFGIDVVYESYIFSILTAIFALLAGIFFFRRK